ncbi:transposable element Tcb2 transposase [Trichonephila clavipes]|nr:transposable element Tcb2 transposase [Trichonephila clavipes]
MIGIMEARWSARRVARQLGHSDCVEISGSERCHLHEDQAQDTLDRPVVKKTATSGAAHEETGLQRKETWSSLATNPDLISAVMTILVRVRRRRGEHLNPAFALQRHTVPTAGVMVWDVIAYNTRLSLVLIRGTMTAQRYVHDILQPHVLPLIQRFPGALFQQDNARPHTASVSQDCLRTVTTLPWPAPSPDLFLIEHIWGLLGRRVEHPSSLNELEAGLQ